MNGFIDYARDGNVAILTMDRPDSLNSIETLDDTREIIAALERLEPDGVRAAVLTGRGRGFSSGGNIKAMQARTGLARLGTADATRANYRDGVHAVLRAFARLEVPMIAAINGAAVGLGLGLANMCDLRIASDKAKFASSFVKIGIIPGDGDAWTLQRLVGPATAAEMLLTGRTYSADEALSMGLIGRVVAGDALIDEAMAIARQIAANPPRALRMTKKLLHEAQTGDFSAHLELCSAFQAIAHETRDHDEALAAMIEKRAPNFTGD